MTAGSTRMAQAAAVNAKDRDKIVPAGEKTASAPASGAQAERPATRSYRLAWASLLARILFYRRLPVRVWGPDEDRCGRHRPGLGPPLP
ncbi:MAG: hypothetical protein MUC50_22790 [Myxococcota bacterium]|nr:hypothetical protein [Myxococcota bacterium]